MNPMTKKQVSIEMDDVFYRTLDAYLLVVNARLRSRGWPTVTKPRLIGAILGYFFLAHHQEILSEANSEYLSEVQRQVRAVADPEELESIGFPTDTDGTDIPTSE